MLHGKRVTLRPFQRADLPALRRWFDDGEIMRYWGERQPLVTADMFERDVEPGGRYTTFEREGYLCICDETGRAIGFLEYTRLSARHRHAELGILIGEHDALNRGYGTEAVIVTLNWLFNQQNLHRVWLSVQENNPRARHVYEKIGFVHEGTWRAHEFYDGAWQNEHFYGMLREEFNARYRPEEAQWVVDGTIP
jgi:RimJ/RimL family protein N-acetyltransferase